MKRFRYKHIISLLLIVSGVMILNSCSTKKNTFTRRVFHNLTAHYNAYFNGKEALLAAEEELDNTVKDNYMKILPVFKLGDKQQADALKPYLDRAIEKGAKVINRHSMEFNRVEYVKWIDNSYLLMGKASFYKKDYIAAKRHFEFVIKKYDAPEKYDAMLWLGKTLIHKEEFEKGQSMLDQLSSKVGGEEEIDKETLRNIPQAYADMFILQEKYAEAIDPIKRAIELENSKQHKTRLMFILAQIYQHEKIDFQATEYYTRVIKRNPDYEMAFNARINLATAFDVNTGDSKLVIKELNKLLKDAKNVDYKDQIYFALAQIANKEKNDTLTRFYLKESVKNSLANDYQKGISSLQLGQLYYEDPNYISAQIYYDTALQFIPRDFKDFELHEKISYTLADLAEHILLVKEQDSLQYLAGLPDNERKKIIDDLIAKIREEQRIQAELERERRESMAFMQQNGRSNQRSRPTQTSGGGSNWYFYNPTSLSFGYTEFMKKWGRRKNEDLWRLSDKRVQEFDFGDLDELAIDSIAGDTVQLSTDPLSPKTYVQNIPLTEEKMEASNMKIANALYKMGFIYKEELETNIKAVEAFESFVSRYPEHEFAVRCYYQLYILFQEENDQANIDKYKNILVGQFPESDYAKLITDPGYFQELIEEQNRVKSLYYDAYGAYEEEQYFSSIIYAEEALITYPKDDLVPKFEYVRALSKGKLDGQDSLVAELRELVRKYPASSITPMARDILSRLNIDAELTQEEKFDIEKEKKINEALQMYAYVPESAHFYVMIVPNGSVNVNATKVRFSDHHIKNYRFDTFKINSLLLNKDWEMITVSGIESADKALSYYNDMLTNTYVFANIELEHFDQFVISSNNYPKFYQSKDVEMYLKFFRIQYLKMEEQ